MAKNSGKSKSGKSGRIARKIELEIPVDIYTGLAEKLEELERETENELREMHRKFDELEKNYVKDIKRLEDGMIKFEKQLKKAVEDYLSKFVKNVHSQIDRKDAKQRKEFDRLVKTVRDNFEEYSEQISKIINKAAKAVEEIDVKLRQALKVFNERYMDLKNSVKQFEREHRKFEKDVEKRLKRVEKYLGLYEAKKKRAKKEVADTIEEPVEKAVEKTSEITKRLQELEKLAPEEEDVKLNIPFFGKPSRKPKSKDLEKMFRKIDSLRKRKKGREFVISIAHLLRDYLRKKYGIDFQTTYMELLEELKDKNIKESIMDQLEWFFEEVMELEYSNEDTEEGFPNLDEWAKRIVEVIERG